MDQADAEMAQRRDDLELDGALGEVIEALLGGVAQQVARGCGQLRGSDIPSGKVRGADIGELALADQLFHRLPDLLPRRRTVDVDLVEIDVVRLQPFRARLAGATDGIK